jgi:hypothetical protein
MVSLVGCCCTKILFAHHVQMPFRNSHPAKVIDADDAYVDKILLDAVIQYMDGMFAIFLVDCISNLHLLYSESWRTAGTAGWHARFLPSTAGWHARFLPSTADRHARFLPSTADRHARFLPSTAGWHARFLPSTADRHAHSCLSAAGTSDRDAHAFPSTSNRHDRSHACPSAPDQHARFLPSTSDRHAHSQLGSAIDTIRLGNSTTCRPSDECPE